MDYGRYLAVSLHRQDWTSTSFAHNNGSCGFSSWPTSTSGSGPVSDRPECKLDQSEAVLSSESTGMTLRSQSRAGRSELGKSAEIPPPKDLEVHPGQNRK